MRNLPPGVGINDSNAPWNPEHPEPDWQCTECDRYGSSKEVKRIDANAECPECGGHLTSC